MISKKCIDDSVIMKIVHDYVLISRGEDKVQIPIHEMIDVIFPAFERFIESNKNHLNNKNYILKNTRKVVIIKDAITTKTFNKLNNIEYYIKDIQTNDFERVSKYIYEKYILEKDE